MCLLLHQQYQRVEVKGYVAQKKPYISDIKHIVHWGFKEQKIIRAAVEHNIFSAN